MSSGPDTTLRFAERVAIITGAGSGMGRAAAALLRAKGAHVVGAAIDPTGVPGPPPKRTADGPAHDPKAGAIGLPR